MEEQNLSGSQEELIPADEVLRVLQASLVLIGNSVNYISQQRREAILSAFPTSRSYLAKILRQICNKDFEVGEKETELFGSKAMEKVSERVNALEAFKKAVAKADTSQKKGSRLLGKGPAAKYGSSAGQSSWHPYSREEAYRGQKQVYHIQKTWGPFSVDLFAARNNTQLPLYYSFRPDPGALAVDAFFPEMEYGNSLCIPTIRSSGPLLRSATLNPGNE